MVYKVMDMFKVGNDTSVTIDGNGDGLHNKMEVFDENNVQHMILSVAMQSGANASSIRTQTTLLIKGEFNSKSIIA